MAVLGFVLLASSACAAVVPGANRTSAARAPVTLSATIIAPELVYDRGVLYATVVYNEKSNVPLQGTLKGPGVEETISIDRTGNMCSSFAISGAGSLLSRSSDDCQWKLSTPSRGPYTLEITADGKVLTSVSFRLRPVPTSPTERVFIVEPSDRTGTAYVRRSAVLTGCPCTWRSRDTSTRRWFAGTASSWLTGSPRSTSKAARH